MPPDQNPLAKALANTYSPESAASGWQRVCEYRRVREYTADHPEEGSQAVSTTVELPRERIRSWVDGDGKPDPVRAIEIADMHAWLQRDWSYSVAHGLNVLVAWIFSGGSISQDGYYPQFTVSGPLSESVLDDAFSRVGLDYRIERHDDPERATEATPTEYSSVFGRTLVAWGAPLGPKHTRRRFSLPRYLWDAPDPVRLDFARTYILNRGHARHDRPDMPIQITEARNARYREEVVSLFRSLVADSETVTTSGDNMIRLAPDASDALFMPPTFGEE